MCAFCVCVFQYTTFSRIFNDGAEISHHLQNFSIIYKVVCLLECTKHTHTHTNWHYTTHPSYRTASRLLFFFSLARFFCSEIITLAFCWMLAFVDERHNVCQPLAHLEPRLHEIAKINTIFLLIPYFSYVHQIFWRCAILSHIKIFALFLCLSRSLGLPQTWNALWPHTPTYVRTGIKIAYSQVRSSIVHKSSFCFHNAYKYNFFAASFIFCVCILLRKAQIFLLIVRKCDFDFKVLMHLMALIDENMLEFVEYVQWILCCWTFCVLKMLHVDVCVFASAFGNEIY